MSQPTASVLVIGNEVLSGRTQDANIGYLGKALAGLGIRLAEARVVADEEDDIVAAVNALRSRYTYVFTTGGIGPTHDDITAAAIAKAFGVPIERHPQAQARLERHYRPGELNAMRLRMAELPRGAGLIDNPVSQAPGFWIENVFVMAGVPAIMQAMFDGLKQDLVGGPPLVARTVWALVPEGIIAQSLKTIQEQSPGVSIGSYPFFRHGQLGVSLVARGIDPQLLDRVAERLADLLRQHGGAPVREDGE
ncbi:MAG: competence/damage-inducible protein A [Rhodospirillales bacterium]|nr:competence/damage-inducible protein A [Rhodospirillales bacterium]